MKLPTRLQRASVPNAMSRRSSAEIVSRKGDRKKIERGDGDPDFQPFLGEKPRGNIAKLENRAANRADRHRVIVKAVRMSRSDSELFGLGNWPRQIPGRMRQRLR